MCEAAEGVTWHTYSFAVNLVKAEKVNSKITIIVNTQTS